MYQAVLQAQAQAAQAQQYQQGKMNAAMHFAAQYGVSPQALMRFDSPDAMEAFGKQEQRIRALEASLAAIKSTT